VDTRLISDIWKAAFGVVRPQKIVCVGRNYGAHLGEEGEEPPVAPLLFAKFANTIIGPGEPIELPEGIGHVDAEAELAIVIGATARRLSPAEALDAVAGYTVANDVTAREAQFTDGQWFRSKGYDTFCPILPGFVDRREIGDGRGLRVTQRLNGTVMGREDGTVTVVDVPTRVAYCSTVCTLVPGDLILTGTPGGVGYFHTPRVSLAVGDVVEVAVEGLGTVSNPVTTTGGGR
jgi:5-carboxymethyl-2-hydroxymuconate isomerase